MEIKRHAYPNEKLVSKEAIPRFLRIVLLACVHQQRPLITRDNHFATGELGAHSNQWLQVSIEYGVQKRTQLCIVPVYTSWAEKRSSDRVVKATIRLDVAREGRIYRFILGSDPVQNDTL
jgi:hypothetical protein